MILLVRVPHPNGLQQIPQKVLQHLRLLLDQRLEFQLLKEVDFCLWQTYISRRLGSVPPLIYYMLLIHIKVYEICNNGNINDHYFNGSNGSNGNTTYPNHGFTRK